MSTIITRNSANSGSTPASLVQGELAINVTDGRLFYGSGSGNNVKEFGVTASYATNALSASYAVSASYEINYETSSSYADFAVSASYAVNADNATSASYASQAGNAAAIDIYSFSSPVDSYLLISNVIATTGVAVGGDTDLRYNSSTNTLTAVNISATSLTGSLLGTASYATQALSSSYALSASYTLSASHALTASFITASNVYGPYGSNSVISASYALTASSALTAQDILIRVLNQSGNPITKGLVVHITASNNSSDIPRIITASYENDNNSANTLGIANETIANGAEGFVMTEGVLKGIDTSAFISGQLIYLGATGSIIGTAPVAPLHAVRLGQVVRVQSNNGSIYVRIDNGYELDELHNVLINTSSVSYGDLLMYSSSLWINSKQLSGSYGLTGSLNATSFTGSLLGTASYATQALSSSFATTASYVLNAVSASFATSSSRAVSASFATTASYVLNAVSASFASTASFVNTLNQNVLITGSLTVGATTAGANENTLILGPAPAGGTGEGGQLLLQAPGGTYTSASMWDNWQNYTRLLRGTNASSDAVVAQFNMHTKQVSFPQYNSPTAFTGTTLVGLLGFDNSGNLITTTTSSGGGGGGVTITNNVDNYVITATGTANTINGESNMQFNGSSLTITGEITSSGAIRSLANGAMYFRGGDDAEFWDINVANTVGIYGQQTQTVAGLKLGSAGATLYGSGSRFGIGTLSPVATLDVNGNLFVASGITGSLQGTASYATQALSSSFATTASYYGGSVTSASYALTASYSNTSTSSSYALNATTAQTASYVLQAVSASFATLAQTANTASYVVTAQTANTASYVVTAQTASYVLNAVSASFATTASYVKNAQTASYVLQAVSASFATLAQTANTASYVVTAQTASYVLQAVSASFATTASYATQALSASWAPAGNPFPYNGNAQISGSLGVTGSFSIQTYDAILANAYVPAISISDGGRNIYDIFGTGSIDAGGRILIDNLGAPSLGWLSRTMFDSALAQSINWQSRIVYDATGTTYAIDWNNRLAVDAFGVSSIDWSSRQLLDSTGNAAVSWNPITQTQAVEINSYTRKNLPLATVVETFSNLPVYASFNPDGEILNGVTFDASVVNFNLVYLETDNKWYPVNVTTSSSSKLLGIAWGVGTGKEKVLIEGTMVVAIASSGATDAPLVDGIDHGLPIYIRTGAGSYMSTTPPGTSGNYVRVLGHAYYQGATATNYWVMKFRPANDWYVI